jgi:hypothetical protein
MKMEIMVATGGNTACYKVPTGPYYGNLSVEVEMESEKDAGESDGVSGGVSNTHNFLGLSPM